MTQFLNVLWCAEVIDGLWIPVHAVIHDMLQQKTVPTHDAIFDRLDLHIAYPAAKVKPLKLLRKPLLTLDYSR